jgi:hypothetical protein
MSSKWNQRDEEMREAKSLETPMSRLVELCRSQDLVVRMIAVTNPKIQHYGSDALDPKTHRFFQQVEFWLLAL